MKIRLNCFPKGKQKALTMSYDDGVRQDKRLIEIFNKYGIKGSFHLNSGLADGSEDFNRIPISEFAEVYKGHEISTHSLTHPKLEMLPTEELIHEILEDRKKLEEVSKYPVRGMSYPFGSYNEKVLDVLKNLGIEYCRTVKTQGYFALPEKFLEWEATCHHNGDLINAGNRFLEEANCENSSLMYVWGHSYEFDNDNNWELIEEFCKLIGNREDVWYATNIQIVDYINAMRNLRFSTTREMVFNPSAQSVWISANGKIVEIKPGTTAKISELL